MKINGNEVRTGMVLEHDNRLWMVAKTQACKPGKGGAYNQVEMKDVTAGTKQNIRFNAAEKVEKVDLVTKPYNYLYAEGDTLHFMDNDTFEQITMEASVIGEAINFLQDNMTVSIGICNDKPITASLPETVIMQITEADAVVKGQTASSSFKPAMLENGVKVLVPQFIAAGERIVVRTEDASYVERAKS